MKPRLWLPVVLIGSLAFALAPGANASYGLIDFEEASHPSAVEGTDASSLYEGLGVTSSGRS